MRAAQKPLKCFRGSILSFFKHAGFKNDFEAAAPKKYLFASAYMDKQRQYGLAIVDECGHMLQKHILPQRGHDMVFEKKSGWVVVFARRPGHCAVAIDVHQKKQPIYFTTPSHTHFYGHGVLSKNGRLLFATENDFEGEKGVIGIYDVSHNFKRMGEFSSYGIGPHELILMPDGNTLCVANGGILTHPETGRAKLNLHTMRSSVVFIDSHTGQLIVKQDVPSWAQRLSLRHMAVDCNGRVWLGGQYEGDGEDNVPLIATASLSQGVCFPNLDEKHRLGLANYVGSVSSGFYGQKIVFSSARGGHMLVFDAKTQCVLSSHRMPGVSGVVERGGCFFSSSLSGVFNGKTSIKHKDLYWDNHIAAFVP